MADRARRDVNQQTALLAESNAADGAVVAVYADPTTHRLLVDVTSSGGDGAILDGVSSSIKATVKDLTNSNPLTTAIVDANGDQITSFGGGVQYTEADTDASITGTAILWEDTSDTLRAVSAAKPLPIGDAGGSLTVDGTVAISGTVTVDSELTTADLDTGAGTDTRAVVGIVGSKSGGAQLIPGDATAGLKVDLGADNDVTVTSGTITTITNVVHVDDNSGSLTVDAPVATPVFVRLSDGTAAISTLPVSLASVPSHAVTNAGTFVVQENGAALTSLQLIDDAIVADDAAFTPATTKVMMAGFTFDDVSPDTVNEGDGGAARMSANRNIYVNIRDNAGNERGLNIDANGEIQISGSRNALTVNSHAVTNAGTFVVQENGAALTSLQLIDDTVYTDDTSTHSTGTSKGFLFMAAATPTDTAVNANDIGAVAMTVNRELLVQVNTALPAGTNAIGKLAANSGVDIGDVDVTSIIPGTGATNLGKAEDAAHTTGDTGVFVLAVRDDTLNATSGTEGDYEALHTNADGALWVSQAPSATGGLSVFAATSQDGGTALTNTAQAIKASAGVLYGWYIYNPNSSATYVVLYNTAAASVTVGTTNPLFVLCIPATSAANIMSPMGIGFSNAGWSVAATTTGGGNTAPATALEAVFFYK